MEVRTATRYTEGQNRASLKMYNGRSGGYSKNNVCVFWLKGNCNRNPCRFLHSDSAPISKTQTLNLRVWTREKSMKVNSELNPNGSPTFVNSNGGSRTQSTQNNQEEIIEKIKDTAITGIALPSGSDRLYSSCKDGTVRVWDCNSGHCGNVINLEGKVGSLISEGPWVFVGVKNHIKAWNIQTCVEHILIGPVEQQVCCMVVGNDTLFAGLQDGTILAWKSGSETNPFQLAASLKGHTHSVVSLTAGVGGTMLFSGSMDHTIKVWNTNTLQCVQTLNEHSDVVMSLLCWDMYLLSASLDGTIKVWAATESGALEVTYTHNEDHGVLALCGIHDSEGKPILMCSCNDDSVRLHELPSFYERGRLFSKKEVRIIQTGPQGLFFTGDGDGCLTIWKWLSEQSVEAS